MALLWAMLPVFLVCAEAQNVTEVRGKLGGSINLKCSENFSNIYWYMEIHSRFRVEILRTFSQNSEPSYCSVDFKSKFSIQRNELVITNITSGEYRLYFCAKRIQDRISYVDAIRLVSDVAAAPSTDDCERRNGTAWWSSYLTYSSLTLNAFLTLTVTGLVGRSLHLKRKKRNLRVNDPSGVRNGNTATVETPQYQEIQLSPHTIPPPAAPPECIYYKAQLPRSRIPLR
ncbi:uncharacterized protein LOC120797966 [Xiphias gladius]|uniref:uncharacterized protein LOC120797966 n=1 Tax=Xiphias gladius TaxID=8245 RepID=UPI001A99D5B1|nr:uncharacterized protein LOC120797966 [Xiphias gladius]XP_039997749.1 uncharacterized protein LOC120797966 [Xiphias gladius]